MSSIYEAAVNQPAVADHTLAVAALASGSSVLATFAATWAAMRSRRKPDATEISRTGLEIVPEMGDRVLEALSKVQELTEKVAAAQLAAAKAQAQAEATQAELALVRIELDAAKSEARQLRAENAALRVENEQLRTGKP